jgi:hypothetical protein
MDIITPNDIIDTFTFKRIFDDLIKYQQKNNIVGKCVENSIFISDCLDCLGFTHKIINGVCSYVLDGNNYIHSHTFIKIGNDYIEPSLELANRRKGSSMFVYHETFKEHKESVPSHLFQALHSSGKYKKIIDGIVDSEKKTRLMKKNSKISTDYIKELTNHIISQLPPELTISQ